MDDSTQLTRGVVGTRLTVDVLDPIEVVASLGVDVRYDSSEPFSVTMTFLTVTGDVTWTFSRDLLAQGLLEPAGDGDIRLWPSRDMEANPVIVMELESPDGSALIQAPAAAMVEFFDRTVALVPLGAESMDSAIETALSAILAGKGA